MMPITDYSAAELRRIISIKEQIESLQRQLAEFDGNHEAKAQGPRRTMSAAARRKIGLAQKARWAKQKGDAAPKRKRRKMSVEGRARMAAAAKARWAKVKASQTEASAA